MQPRPYWVQSRPRNIRTPKPKLKVTAMTYETDFDDLYGSKYLTAGDLHGKQPRHRIGKVDVSELKEKDGSTKRKFVAYLEGVEKPLVLNKTNATKLAGAYGKDRSAWVGTTVALASMRGAMSTFT